MANPQSVNQNSVPPSAGVAAAPVRPRHRWWLWAIIIVVLGILAGALGSLLLMFSGPLKIPGLKNLNLTNYLPQKEITVETVREVTVNPDVQVGEVIKSMSAQLVTIYKVKNGGADVLKQIYGPQDILARGFVLTNDGWLVTVARALPGVDNLRVGSGAVAKINSKNIAAKLAELTIAAGDKGLYAPSKALFDPLTGLVFLKIEARDLAVAKLGEKDNASLGQELLIITADQIFRNNLKGLNNKVIANGNDMLRSPDEFADFITLNLKDTWTNGSAVADLSGAIMGLTDGGQVVPTIYLRQLVAQVLKDGGNLASGTYLQRPRVGFGYLDLHNQRGLTADIYKDLQAGALIVGQPVNGSPAGVAGLKSGDVITKINDDRLNGKRSLAEYIWDYTPGAELDLTVTRAGKEEKLKLKLGAWTVK